MPTPDALPPPVRKALKRLQADLAAAGYETDEVRSIVEGAREHAELKLHAAPDTDPQALAAELAGFAAPDLQPDPTPAAGKAGLARLALALGAAGGALMIAGLFVGGEETGGALMLFAALFGGGGALGLGWMSRAHRLGRAAMGLGGGLIAFLCLSLALAIAG